MKKEFMSPLCSGGKRVEREGGRGYGRSPNQEQESFQAPRGGRGREREDADGLE